ncbi:MAG: TRL-like family protein [Leptospiraceae bacterium]|nr:TRL-like family protein [Leptospiraceae bacterium]MCP5501098.1 TRL-like family protein [Leptospiraceae bacterium]
MKTLIFSIILLFFWNCTGVNLMSGVLRWTSNTHPVPDYAGAYAYEIRGGALYYSDTVDGQIGDKVEKATLKGEACSSSILWLISLGDSSIRTARRNAKITKIKFVSHKIEAFFAGYIYQSHCTIVEGE